MIVFVDNSSKRKWMDCKLQSHIPALDAAKKSALMEERETVGWTQHFHAMAGAPASLKTMP
jgi:hypothetical protein